MDVRAACMDAVGQGAKTFGALAGHNARCGALRDGREAVYTGHPALAICM